MKNARRRARRLEFWEMGFKCLIIDFAALRHDVMVQERIRMLLSIDLFPHTYLLLGDIPHIKAGPLKMSLNVTVFLFQEVWKAYLRHGSLLTLMFLKLNHILDGDIHSLCRRRTLLSSIIFLGWHFRLLLGCEHTALKVAFAETWKNAALGLGLVCPSVCVCVFTCGWFECRIFCVRYSVWIPGWHEARLNCLCSTMDPKGLSASTTAALNHLQPAQTGLIWFGPIRWLRWLFGVCVCFESTFQILVLF